MANAVYLVMWETHQFARGTSSGIDKVFVGEEKEAKRQAREYAEAKEKRSRSRFYTALKARDVAFVNETTIGQ